MPGSTPLLLKAVHLEKFCTLDALQNVEDDHELYRGISRAKGFPKDASLAMSSRYKKQVALADVLAAPGHLNVVSKKFRTLVESLGATEIEFLPVTIFDHKKKAVAQEFFVLNPLRIVDCIDREKSKLDWNIIDPDLISGVHKLELDLQRIPAKAGIFRPKHLWHRLLVERNLAAAIEKECSGAKFGETDKFMGS